MIKTSPSFHNLDDCSFDHMSPILINFLTHFDSFLSFVVLGLSDRYLNLEVAMFESGIHLVCICRLKVFGDRGLYQNFKLEHGDKIALQVYF